MASSGQRSARPYSSLLMLLAGASVPAIVAYPVIRKSSFSYAFLWDPTSWDIGFAFLPFTSSDPYWWAFVVGLVNTAIAAALAIALTTLLGFALSLARSASNPMLSGGVRLYTDVIRNVPVILQAMFWYSMYLGMPRPREAITLAGAKFSNRGVYMPVFADPLAVIGSAVTVVLLASIAIALWSKVRRRDLRFSGSTVMAGLLAVLAAAALAMLGPRLAQGVQIVWPEIMGLNIRGGVRLSVEFSALVTAVVFYRAAYAAEVFRAGFRSVSQGHLDAAHALNLSAWTTLTKIRIPLALITILPPLTSEFVVIVKITSIGLLVGFNDLYAISVNATTVTGRTLEIMTLMTAAYLLINLTITQVMNEVNRRVASKGMA